MQEEVPVRFERAWRGAAGKALPFLKAKVSTNRQKAYSMSSGNAYGAVRHKNVNKHIPTNVHTEVLVYTHIQTHRRE